MSPTAPKTFTIGLKNIGEETDTYHFYIESGPPGGWSAELSAPGSTLVESSSYYSEYTVDLDPAQGVDVSVKVQVTGNPESTSTGITVMPVPKRTPTAPPIPFNSR